MHDYNIKYSVDHEELLKVTSSEETVKVVISGKRRKILTTLLQSTNRKSYTVYKLAPFPTTLRGIQDHSPIASAYKWTFCPGMLQMTRFQMTQSVARSPFLQIEMNA